MNINKVIEFFEHVYPGKPIVMLPQDNPKEIICEIEPMQGHPEFSVAIASIAKSAPHQHKHSTETYLVLDGTLIIHINDKVLILNKGDTCTVMPNEIHWAEGYSNLVQVTSRPGWTQNDHIFSK